MRINLTYNSHSHLLEALLDSPLRTTLKLIKNQSGASFFQKSTTVSYVKILRWHFLSN
jgi:hypothetical protein